nr:nitrilase-related carbon-nitrogen hydrolase [Cyclobacteriaceae bacterium]
AWDTLLKARAIENLSYVVGANRVGMDGKGIEYNGLSAVVNPKGEPVFTLEGMEAIKTVAISGNSLLSYRDKFPAFLDADDFSVEVEPIPEEGY